MWVGLLSGSGIIRPFHHRGCLAADNRFEDEDEDEEGHRKCS
jgi:hypothetical protein